MKTKLKPKPTGIYHPQSRLQWYAVAFETAAGEPYIIAAPTRRGAIRHAARHTAATKMIVERINITKGPKQ
ncbi:hypothetical protein UFOVP612_6 [uncultured Caudovirales phage]|uniref:Uncharacterized protein n=1 Tax=uncultured Caudovirales phage TaxID=2100421 RepID=A0A6J5N559_9CAUD|nr:hypothetical protein UFOVP612_6 [uncultured Caudovirales phage]